MQKSNFKLYIAKFNFRTGDQIALILARWFHFLLILCYEFRKLCIVFFYKIINFFFDACFFHLFQGWTTEAVAMAGHKRRMWYTVDSNGNNDAAYYDHIIINCLIDQFTIYDCSNNDNLAIIRFTIFPDDIADNVRCINSGSSDIQFISNL